MDQASTRRILRARGLLRAAALLVAVVAGCMVTASHGIFTGRPAEPPDCAALAAAREHARLAAEAEREAVLALVRRHRAGASEAWLRRLADAIYEEAVGAGLDPLMVAAVAAKESSFRSRVVSHAGAVGLMQLRPFVARDVAERRNVEWTGIETLQAPDLNVRLGVLYLQELIERFGGDLQQALTAYNYGPTRVSRQLRAGTYQGSGYANAILELYDSLTALRAPLAGASRG